MNRAIALFVLFISALCALVISAVPPPAEAGPFAMSSASGNITPSTVTASTVTAVTTATSGTTTTSNLIVASIAATAASAPTIASANTIAPTKSITFVNSTTAVVTITPPAPIASGGGCIQLIPTAAWTTTTAGNIALASTAVANKVMTMCYDVGTNKFYPSY